MPVSKLMWWRCVLVVAWVIGSVVTPSAHAQKAFHRSPHLDETANIIGFKAGPVAQFGQGEGKMGGGISAYYERNLIAGWLEIEPAIAVFWVDEETIVPIEVLLKKPFHANEVINPYTGMGPELALIFTPHGNRARFGLKFVGGSYFWFGEGPWGMDLEIAYVLLFDDHTVHELALETGFAFRF
jgi:hypothetical protein